MPDEHRAVERGVPRCDRVSRRHFVGVGLLTMLGVTAWSPQVLANFQASARRRRCILVWLDGGPSHLETFDPKPNAAAEVRGPMQAISTSIPGVQLNECLPQLAKRLDRMALIRSMTSPLGEHNLAAQYLLTGYRPSPSLEYPVLGSAVAHVGGRESTLPSFVAIPNHRVGGGKFSTAGYLPMSARPYETGGDPKHRDFQVESLQFYPGLNAQRLERRRSFLNRLDGFRREADQAGVAADNRAWQDAVELVSDTQVRKAFTLEEEADQLRQTYGWTTPGQSCLLARRLVERGVSFVTVNFPGWDTHDRAYLRLREGYTGAAKPVGLIPQLDQAVSGLVDDLADRRLLDDTLVVVMGEFGRTPKLNTTGGRDHWPRAFSVLVAGGGTPQGIVIGKTDAQGREPTDQPVTPEDLTATIYKQLGIDPARELQTADGRPIRLNANGKIITELVGDG